MSGAADKIAPANDNLAAIVITRNPDRRRKRHPFRVHLGHGSTVWCSSYEGALAYASGILERGYHLARMIVPLVGDAQP